MSRPLLEIRARLVLLRQEEGGRRTPIGSGYRPALYIGGKQSDGAVYLLNQQSLAPGEACEAHIKLLHPEGFGDDLKPKATFELREGTQVVARGTVTEVLPEQAA